MFRVWLTSVSNAAKVYKELGQTIVTVTSAVLVDLSSHIESTDGLGVSLGNHVASSSEISTFPNTFIEIATACLINVPGWSDLVDDIATDVEVTTLVPGLSNSVYKVSFFSKALPAVLYRVYSSSTLYDPSIEEWSSKIVSDFHLGPKFIASGLGWRIEEFLEKYIVTTSPLLMTRPVYLSVATELGKLHRISKNSLFPSEFKSRPPSVFSRLSDWRDQALLVEDYYIDPRILSGVDELLATITNESRSSPLGYHVVFSHNDVNPGNIMMLHKESVNLGESAVGIRLIDFEFSDMNFQASDLAKFFVYASLPPREWRDFLQEYLSEYLMSVFIYPDQLAELQRAIPVFVKEYNLMWGLWSLIKYGEEKNVSEKSGFDFLENAEIRFQTYLNLIH